MTIKFTDLQCKEVICISDGRRLGFITDVQIEVPEGNICAIVVPGPCRFLGVAGRQDDFIIPWNCIKRIGPDIVLVDDGSDEAHKAPFAEAARHSAVTVLRHEVNRGKGCALKTGYTYIRDNIPEASGVITADADGQHTVPDCWKLAEALTADKRALYLGSRDCAFRITLN